MHRAYEDIDLVSLDQLVGIFRRLAGVGFVIDDEILDLAPAELAAILCHRQLETVGDTRSQLSESPCVGQHQADAQLA